MRSPSAGQFLFDGWRRIAQWFAAFLQNQIFGGLIYIGEPPTSVLRRFHRKTAPV